MNLFEFFFLILFSKKQISTPVETNLPVVNERKTEVLNEASNKIIKSVSKKAEEKSPVLSAVETPDPTSLPIPTSSPTATPTLKPTSPPVPTTIPTIMPLPSFEPCPMLPIKPGRITKETVPLVYCPEVSY